MMKQSLAVGALVTFSLSMLTFAISLKALPGNSPLPHSPAEDTCPDPRAISRPAVFESPAVNPIVYDTARDRVYVADIANSQIAVLDPMNQTILSNIPVGIGPSAVALAPIPDDPTGRTRLLVSNSLSDSISVIDPDLLLDNGRTGAVVDTLAGVDSNGRSLLDTPTGLVVSADGRTGYVALSKLNQIAVLDLQQMVISSTRYSVPLLDPRALALSDDGQTLYAASFTPGNRTYLHFKGIYRGQPFDAQTLPWSTLIDVVGDMNFTLDVDDSTIEVDPTMPDNDILALDVTTGISQTVGDVGAVLYDLAVQGNTLNVAGTEALNTANNFPDDMAGRPIRNLLVSLSCSGLTCEPPAQIDLDLLDGVPDRTTSAAIPSAVVIAPDANRYVTALGSNVLLQLDPNARVLNRYPVGAMPIGVALDPSGATAYVLNQGDNSVSVVDTLSGSVSLIVLTADPLPATIIDGRRVFFDASHSRNGSLACASCHPNANIDNLVWSLGDGKHTTQTAHRIAGTTPYHWLGTIPDAFTLVNGNYTGPMFQYRPNGEEYIGLPTGCELSHTAEYMESVDMMAGPTRPLSDQMSLLARYGAAIVRRGQVIFDNNVDTNIPDPVMLPRYREWMRPWTHIPPGGRLQPINSFGNCAHCHANGLETQPPMEDGAGNPPSLAGVFERSAFMHDGRGTSMAMRQAINTLVDTINQEITRRNTLLPAERQIPLLDEHNKILTTSTNPDNARRAFHSMAHRANITPFTAQNWVRYANRATLLNPFFLFDRYIAYLDEQSTGYSAAYGQQVTANTTWISSTHELRLNLLLSAAQIQKVSLHADGVLTDGAEGWQPVQSTYEPDTDLFVDISGQTYTSSTLISLAQAGLGYVTFTGEAAGDYDVVHSLPLIDNIVRAATAPNLDGSRSLARLRATEGSVELLIRGAGFASGDMVLNDGQLLGTIGQVDVLPTGQLEGHFTLTVDPARANDYYILSVHNFAAVGGLTSNEFAIPVTP